MALSRLSHLPVTFFRSRRSGPELAIEDAVAACSETLFPSGGYPTWTAGSLAIGAGMPDLLIAICDPDVYALSNTDLSAASILAYLRAVGRVRLQTLADRFCLPVKRIARSLDRLVEAQAVSTDGRMSFMLVPKWREILPEIVTIEAKVVDWRRAAEQAGRNRIFAHRSYVALPHGMARRVAGEPSICRYGIGVLSVGEDGDVVVVRNSRKHKPKVWSYYYLVALHAARYSGAQQTHDGGSLCPSRCQSTAHGNSFQNTSSSVR